MNCMKSGSVSAWGTTKNEMQALIKTGCNNHHTVLFCFGKLSLQELKSSSYSLKNRWRRLHRTALNKNQNKRNNNNKKIPMKRKEQTKELIQVWYLTRDWRLPCVAHLGRKIICPVYKRRGSEYATHQAWNTALLLQSISSLPQHPSCNVGQPQGTAGSCLGL